MIWAVVQLQLGDVIGAVKYLQGQIDAAKCMKAGRYLGSLYYRLAIAYFMGDDLGLAPVRLKRQLPTMRNLVCIHCRMIIYSPVK